MLTPTQIDFITFLAWSVWFGFVAGGLAGLITGASILVIRTHRVSSLLPGAFSAAMPAAGFGIAVSLIIGLLQMALCKPGHKAGWDVPVWSMSIQAIVVFIAGVLGALVMLRHRPVFRWGRVFAVALLGAVLGCIAHLGSAFDGYYVIQSNARPIRQAITGFAAGGIAVVLWYFVVRLFYRSTDDTPSA